MALVSALNRVDLPTLGRPTMPMERLTCGESRAPRLLRPCGQRPSPPAHRPAAAASCRQPAVERMAAGMDAISADRRDCCLALAIGAARWLPVRAEPPGRRRGRADRPGPGGRGTGPGRAGPRRARRRPARPSGSRRCRRRRWTVSARRFIEMAEGRLSAANGPAAGELESRRAAVEHLVGPLRETLARVEAQLRESDADRHALACRAGRAGDHRPAEFGGSSAPRPRPWSPRCGGRRPAAGGARCSCAGWSSWPG